MPTLVEGPPLPLPSNSPQAIASVQSAHYILYYFFYFHWCAQCSQHCPVVPSISPAAQNPITRITCSLFRSSNLDGLIYSALLSLFAVSRAKEDSNKLQALP